MIQLAKNEKAVLLKVRNEYWIMQSNLHFYCLNSQESDYNANHALAYFIKKYGEPTEKHPRIKFM